MVAPAAGPGHDEQGQSVADPGPPGPGRDQPGTTPGGDGFGQLTGPTHGDGEGGHQQIDRLVQPPLQGRPARAGRGGPEAPSRHQGAQLVDQQGQAPHAQGDSHGPFVHRYPNQPQGGQQARHGRGDFSQRRGPSDQSGAEQQGGAHRHEPPVGVQAAEAQDHAVDGEMRRVAGQGRQGGSEQQSDPEPLGRPRPGAPRHPGQGRRRQQQADDQTNRPPRREVGKGDAEGGNRDQLGSGPQPVDGRIHLDLAKQGDASRSVLALAAVLRPTGRPQHRTSPSATAASRPAPGRQRASSRPGSVKATPPIGWHRQPPGRRPGERPGRTPAPSPRSRVR